MPQDRNEREAPPTDQTGSRFAPALRVVSGLTLLSRVAGLARDAVCSRIFGAGPVWSAFAFAFLLPNLFRRLFGEGALSAAFLPEYAQLQKNDPALARRFASATMGVLLVVLGALTLLGELLLLFLLVGTPLGQHGALALKLAMVMLPFMPLVCASAILGGMLQTHGRFGPTAASPVLLNLFIIAAAAVWAWGLGADLVTTVFAVAISVVLAGAAQVAWSLLALRRNQQWTTSLAGASAPVRRMAVRMGPVIIGLGALQINTLLDGLIASWPILVGPTISLPGLGRVDYPLDESSNAVLFFTQRLYQFPLGVFGIALATAIFPALARESDEPERFSDTLRRGVRLSLFIGLPASMGLAFVRHDLAAVILGGGAFVAEDIDRVAFVLLGYSPAIWAYMLSHLFSRAFYALGDTATPMRISLLTVGVNLALNLVLIWPLAEAGLAWATSICAVGQCLALGWLLARRSGRAVIDPVGRGAVGRAIGLTLAMAIALGALLLLLPGAAERPEWTARALTLAAMVAVGAVVYLAGARALGMSEPGWLLERRRPDSR